MMIIAGGGGWCVETEPKVAGSVDDDIIGFDVVYWVLGRWGFEVEQVHESAIDREVGAARDVDGKR